MKLIKSFFKVALITAVFASCSKEGPAGTAGKDGNPTVFYSDWLPTGTVTAGTVDGNAGNLFTLVEPKLNQDILDRGAVLVYLQISTGSDFTSLPLPYITGAGGGANTIAYYPRLGEIKILRFKNDGTNGAINLTSTWKWRYILIPGGTKTTAKNATTPNFNEMSYFEVCSYFNIKP